MFTQYNSNKTLFLLKYKVKHFINMTVIKKHLYVPYTKSTDQGIILLYEIYKDLYVYLTCVTNEVKTSHCGLINICYIPISVDLKMFS